MISFIYAILLPFLALGTKLPIPNTNRTSFTFIVNTNDVENGFCAPLTVIYARGTNEPGNIGVTIGPSMFLAYANALNGNVALQGVNYPADPQGIALRGASGAQFMIALAKLAKEQCPDTNLTLTGYSQGAFVAHYALNSGGLACDDVDAVAVFGDPEFNANGSFGVVPRELIAEYCNEGDHVCQEGVGNITWDHISYMGNGAAQDAVQFILNVTGLAQTTFSV